MSPASMDPVKRHDIAAQLFHHAHVRRTPGRLARGRATRRGPVLVTGAPGDLLGRHPGPDLDATGHAHGRAAHVVVRREHQRRGRARAPSRPDREPAPRHRLLRSRHRCPAAPAGGRTAMAGQPLQRRQMRRAGTLLGRHDGLRLPGPHRIAVSGDGGPAAAAHRVRLGRTLSRDQRARVVGRWPHAVAERHGPRCRACAGLRPRHGSRVAPAPVAATGRRPGPARRHDHRRAKGGCGSRIGAALV